MRLEENEGFLSLGDDSNCGRSEGLRSRNSIIISQATNRSIFSSRISPAAKKVGFMLGGDEEEFDEEMDHPLLFTQLNELFIVGEDVEWKETARWMKFEEKVEDGGERWSKPHVTTLSLHSLFELRTCIEKGTILLDFETSSFKHIIETVTSLQIANNALKPELKEKIMHILLRRPLHLTKKSRGRMAADVGKNCCRGKTVLSKTTMTELSERPLKEQLKNRFKKKIPKGTEVSNILVGEVDFLDKPFIAFVRLQEAVILGALTEVALPSRFLFILLGPKAKLRAYHEIGRAIATLITDELFQCIAHKAMNKDELVAGIDEFLDELTVLPPGKWDPTVRIQPPKFLPSPQKRKAMLFRESKSHCNRSLQHPDERLAHGHPHESEELKRTGRLFGGLVNDIQRKARWFWSDFYDALNIQCLSAILFIYLATVTNAITFGGMLGEATDNMQGVLESFLGTAIAGAAFCLFSGQPLAILSSTGPVLVFERLLFNFSRDHALNYLEFRLWIGLWVAFFCLILVATEASYLVQYFTRFTEEGFCALISCIFIYDACKKMINLMDYFPINWEYIINNVTLYRCACTSPNIGNHSVLNESMTEVYNSSANSSIIMMHQEFVNWSQLTKKECLKLGGHLEGNSCNYVPDVTLMSLILFFGTFVCCTSLKHFKASRYFPASVRKLVSDFAIIMAILIFCGIDAFCGLETPKLIVPSEFKPTNPSRGWIVFPFGGNPWWMYLAAGVPAILVTILLFMDQQITAVILNRKEFKLQKGAGFHLDFFCVAVLIIVTSLMGLPWYVSATVISLAHMDSLKMETTKSAPGEQPKFLGIREQRVTGLLVFILTGISVFLSPILKYIPMPVLYGIFLYMGVTALGSLQGP
ncbi:electrogenic sodium bicarbonate cotransporter 1-like isoform X2 [Rhinatrema bivittatum]|uniref:electrogenic sodium bicarbonate cotransporter 1-like isoform X2 n=1 Tax=Rhinatrema bivittatum TaxID=194408 RepID=UPI00112E21EC|nr:electrogenic sodium bicarbonate cotransporter 1-like isoform X2 [Rhinatrema bivittatum]